MSQEVVIVGGARTPMCEYVGTVVQRYRGRVDGWHLTSASNYAIVLGLGEDEAFILTARVADAARQVDPGAELTRLYEAILRDSPEVAPRSPAVRRALNGTATAAPTAFGAAPEPSPPGAVDAGPAPDPKPAEPPRTLPYDLPDFTGTASRPSPNSPP